MAGYLLSNGHMKPCPERERLHREANRILALIGTLLEAQKTAIAVYDREELLDLDRKLELEFGNKERTFGALWQHTDEHGC